MLFLIFFFSWISREDWQRLGLHYLFNNHDTVVDGGVLCRYASCMFLHLYMDPLFPSSRKTESNNHYVLISSVQVLLTEVYNLQVMPIPHSTFYWLSSPMHQAYVNMPQWTSHAQYLDSFMKPRLQGGIWIKGGISIKRVHFCPQHSPNRIDCIYLKDYAGKRLVWMPREITYRGAITA